MSELSSLIGQKIELVVSGRPQMDIGILVDVGDDILVYTARRRYFYVPLKHLHYARAAVHDMMTMETEVENPIEHRQGESISYRKTLLNARGSFIEIEVAGNYSLSGYITSIMNDYFVFYSSVFHTVYVSLDHLKAIIPYPADVTPYSAENVHLTVKPSPLTLSRVFEQQLKKLEGSMVILDLGGMPDKVGLLQSVEQGFLTLVTAAGELIVWNVNHIKSAHSA